MSYIDIALTDADKAAIGRAVESADKEAITGLIKKVGLQVSDVQRLSNPLVSAFQGEDIPVGGLIEHYDFASLQQQNDANKAPNVGKIGLLKFDYDPESTDMFVPHKVITTNNLNDISLKYKVPASLYSDTILEAFDSQGRISSYVASWLVNFENKIFQYKYAAMEQLVAVAASDSAIFSITVNEEDPISDSTDIYTDAAITHVKKLIFAISKYAYNFTQFPSDKWNIAKHDKQTPSIDQLTLLLNGSALSEAFNVALSTIYNYSLVDIRKIRTIVLEDGVLPAGTEAMLVDNNFLRMHNAKNVTLSAVDIDKYTTQFVHHDWDYYLYNGNFNAAVFKSVKPASNTPSTGK